MDDINNNLLLKMHNTNYEFVIIANNKAIFTDNEDEILEHEANNKDLDYIIFTSDFETMFNIKKELIKRGLYEQ
jgi:hypothetical protein